MFLGQINARLGLVKRNEIKHGMLVVEDTSSKDVVGFLEMGMLPPPTTSEQNSLADGASDEDRGTGVPSGERSRPAGSAEDDAGPILGKTADVVYLANVVVDKSQRRRGIGRKMVESAMEVVRQLWPEEEAIYVTVEKVRRAIPATMSVTPPSVASGASRHLCAGRHTAIGRGPQDLVRWNGQRG